MRIFYKDICINIEMLAIFLKNQWPLAKSKKGPMDRLDSAADEQVSLLVINQSLNWYNLELPKNLN